MKNLTTPKKNPTKNPGDLTIGSHDLAAKLFAAVVKQAMLDVQAGKPDARFWLVSTGIPWLVQLGHLDYGRQLYQFVKDPDSIERQAILAKIT